MAFNINNKVALITGAASGLGLCFVKEFLKNGAKGVAILDIDSEKGLNALEEIHKEFGKNRCIFKECDATQSKKLEEAFQYTVDVFHQLDIVVNNAGIFDEDDWNRTLAVNLNACINGTLLAAENYLPRYKSDNEGVVVNLSSIAGFRHITAGPVYTASKYGVLGFSRAYGHEIHYKRTKVKVIAYCPGFTDTNIVKINPDTVVERLLDGTVMLLQTVTYLQPPEHVAVSLVEVVKVGKSGSVWVVEDNEPPFEKQYEKGDVGF